MIYEDIDNIKSESIMKMVNKTYSKILVIDSFDLFEKAKADKKVLLGLLYSLKNLGINVIA